MFVSWLRPFYEADGGGGDGGQGGEEGGKVRASDLLNRYSNDAVKMAEKLAEVLEDNYRLREKNRKLKDVPADALILSGADKATYEALQALGTPEDITTALTEREQAQAELGKLRRADTIRAAAEAHGYKPSVLGKLPNFDHAIEVREVKDGEQTVKRAFVKLDGGEQTLSDYVQREYADFLPALQTETKQDTGARFIKQDAGGKAPEKNAGAQHVQKTKYAVPGKQ